MCEPPTRIMKANTFPIRLTPALRGNHKDVGSRPSSHLHLLYPRPANREVAGTGGGCAFMESFCSFTSAIKLQEFSSFIFKIGGRSFQSPAGLMRAGQDKPPGCCTWAPGKDPLLWTPVQRDAEATSNSSHFDGDGTRGTSLGSGT